MSSDSQTSEGNKGRDHDHYGYAVWMAGGGVKSGFSYGATDEFGLTAMHNRMHVHDLHATILHLMGLDHEKLTYRYSGRDYRLTDVHGQVVLDLFARKALVYPYYPQLINFNAIALIIDNHKLAIGVPF